MNIILDIPEDLQTHIKAQIRSGVYSNAAEYFLDLGQQDCQRQRNRSKIEHLLQESLDSDSESITPEYWTKLRASILDGEQGYRWLQGQLCYAQGALTRISLSKPSEGSGGESSI
jgi:antitoxin ParD1/3/4